MGKQIASVAAFVLMFVYPPVGGADYARLRVLYMVLLITNTS